MQRREPPKVAVAMTTGKENNMFPPRSVCPSGIHRITILFDHEDSQQRELLQAFRDAFGEHHSNTEALCSSRHVCLSLYPGGALELVA
jgi:hypothetical protein